MPDEIKQNLKKAYDQKAQHRNASPLETWKLTERERFLALLLREQKQTLLELGAGPGNASAFFQANGLHVLCTDFSPEMVKLCQQKGLSAQIVDFSNLPFAPASFDAVYAMNCLLHLPKQEMPKILTDIATILKPGGLFYLGQYGGYDHEGVWQDDFYEPKRFFSFYSDTHLLKVVKSAFQVHSFRQFIPDKNNSHITFQSLILRNA